MEDTKNSDNLKGRLTTIDLLIKLACFVTKVSNIFSLKMSRSELVITRRSTVLNLALQKGFPAKNDPKKFLKRFVNTKS